MSSSLECCQAQTGIEAAVDSKVLSDAIRAVYEPDPPDAQNLNGTSDKLQLILTRLSRTSAVTHRLLVEMHSSSELRSTPLSDRQIQLLVLCSSLGGLHVRLWRFRWLHDASADWTNSPGDLEVIMENLGSMVGFFDNSQIFSDSNPLLQSNRNDLICTVSNLYTLPVGSAIDKLSNLLFNQIKGPQNGVDICSLVLEVLQHAACFDPRIFERLISFFISSCSADPSDLKPTFCKLNQLSYVLQFVAKSLLESNQDDRKLITCLMKNLNEQRRFFCSLPFVYSVSFLESLERIGFAFRIATCLSELQQQKELFLAYKETLSENSSTSPSAIILLCFIATGICGETVLLENIADLLSEFMKYATAVLCSDSEDPDCSVDALLSTFIAQGYASVLNKCPEPLPQDVVLTFSEHMEQSQRSKELTLPIEFTQIWSTWCLRSLISHPGQSRFPLVGRILDVLFSTFESQGTRQTKISEPQQLSMAFLEKQFKNFCSPAPQVGDITSDLCHWQSTSLFEQKCCVLILDPLAARLRRFRDSSEANSVTKDAFLLAYLNLSSQLPADLLTNQLNEVIQNCLDAVTQSSSPSVQSAGLQLFYLLFNRMRSEKNGLFSQISPAYADDLFDALPHLARASLPSLLPEADGDVGRREDNRSKTVSLETIQAAAQVRLCIARCLGCLINLPADIINRHRDTEVFPLLANLVDDPNRCVRLEAARAQNSWYLRG
ncbi:unnamed protein product [Calicophoron daubneyi]|uniref:MMS19 nucleotide excision repair protein n=1 Tax=Calicophoron daubneyi TaxID=300641 RepID=A0AAV2T517_CALDB